MYKIYEVQNGDTLDSIARKIGVNKEVIATLNGFNITSSLMPGTYIVVPSSDSLFDRYVIEKGDTIYEIARKYNLDPDQLARLNGLKDADYIYTGETIMIPKQGTSFYITNEGDTLSKVASAFKVNQNDLLNQNPTIYLNEDQLIVYKN